MSFWDLFRKKENTQKPIPKDETRGDIMKSDFEKMADVRIEKVMELYIEENNYMALFVALRGDGFWKLELTPGAGHNYYYIMEAIYRYHNAKPEDKIDKYYEETLMRLSRLCSSEKSVSVFLSIVVAELDYKKQGISPFEINMIEVLNLCREQLRTDPKLYKEEKTMEKVREYDKYINQKYGYKVL